VAEPQGVAAEIRRRFGGLIDRVSFYSPDQTDAETWDTVLQGLKSGLTGGVRPAAGAGAVSGTRSESGSR
jgi:hypothetical protein